MNWKPPDGAMLNSWTLCGQCLEDATTKPHKPQPGTPLHGGDDDYAMACHVVSPPKAGGRTVHTVQLLHT